MKTPEDYLNEVAKEIGYKHILHSLSGSDVRNFSIIEKAMNRYAADKCKEQREICAEKAAAYAVYSSDEDGTYDGVVQKSSILNAPLATDKQ